MSRCAILLVNWNGWADTIECLESLFRLDHENFRVIICDNGSEDNSLALIKAWADGELDLLLSCGSPHKSLVSPPVHKKIPYVVYARQEAEVGGDPTSDPHLVLIDNQENLGFAGGNNVGLRYLAARGDYDFVWLLNNDTVVAPDALNALVGRMAEKPAAGICGSTLLHYHKPERVQVCGGAYYCSWLGLPWHFGQLRDRDAPVSVELIEKLADYIVGASMLVSRAFIEQVGLMCEDYFLYYEEIDWAIRARGAFTLTYAADSYVYHKVGAAIGTSTDPRKKTPICDYYAIRNRILLTRNAFLGILTYRLLVSKFRSVIFPSPPI